MFSMTFFVFEYETCNSIWEFEMMNVRK